MRPPRVPLVFRITTDRYHHWLDIIVITAARRASSALCRLAHGAGLMLGVIAISYRRPALCRRRITVVEISLRADASGYILALHRLVILYLLRDASIDFLYRFSTVIIGYFAGRYDTVKISAHALILPHVSGYRRGTSISNGHRRQASTPRPRRPHRAAISVIEGPIFSGQSPTAPDTAFVARLAASRYRDSLFCDMLSIRRRGSASWAVSCSSQLACRFAERRLRRTR
jgi:hypothetical protein